MYTILIVTIANELILYNNNEDLRRYCYNVSFTVEVCC